MVLKGGRSMRQQADPVRGLEQFYVDCRIPTYLIEN